MINIRTLNGFYQSKEWINLLKTLKQERTDDNGNIICEYCNKPIVKKYDCIGHHKTQLTDENVINADISLNPKNIAFVHHRCHNYIHNKLGHVKRKIYIVYGAPLSGKSTFVKNNALKGDLIVDLDLIWQAISNQDLYIKPHTLNPFVFKIRDLLLDGIKYRLGKWKNAYIVGCYPFKSERERLVKELNAEEILIESSLDECIDRLNNDDSKRDKDIWKKEIEKWFSLNKIETR
ncbi:MAG: HNH endonuclease [Lachnobacterium sp.]|nr:HNH endonuclease [Lachnobacterium sp.]